MPAPESGGDNPPRNALRRATASRGPSPFGTATFSMSHRQRTWRPCAACADETNGSASEDSGAAGEESKDAGEEEEEEEEGTASGAVAEESKDAGEDVEEEEEEEGTAARAFVV